MSESLDRESLLQWAREFTGLSDFGGEDFLEPMQKVLECAQEVPFHEQGFEAFKANIHRVLVNRLRYAEDLKKHPEILDEDVSDPIIVLGLARSGTTKMQRMMSAAPGVQRTLLWRLVNPAPFPDAVPGELDPRITALAHGALSSDDSPEMAAAHVSTGDEPEEDQLLFEFTFDSWVWAILNIPSFTYSDWVHSHSDTPSYQYVRGLLQYLQWQDGGKQSRPWILKSPLHMGRLDAILEAYPNATFLMTHRDPLQALPSVAKLMTVMWSMRIADVDPHVMGQFALKYWSLGAHRFVEAYDRLSLDDRIVHVQYDEVRSGPVEHAVEAFRRSGYPADDEAVRCMLQWEKDNEQGRHGAWHYDLETYGLTPAQVDEAFAPYVERFVKR